MRKKTLGRKGSGKNTYVQAKEGGESATQKGAKFANNKTCLRKKAQTRKTNICKCAKTCRDKSRTPPTVSRKLGHPPEKANIKKKEAPPKGRRQKKGKKGGWRLQVNKSLRSRPKRGRGGRQKKRGGRTTDVETDYGRRENYRNLSYVGNET